MRLNKYIASCGAASRRGADAFIAQGRVTVNGKPVDSIGMDINPDTDTVAVDGTLLSLPEEKVYIMLNKPAGILSTCRDDRGRKTVLNLVGTAGTRLFPVGRLDYDTEGLLLLTNDGDFAYRCTHPRHEIDKTYSAVVHGRLDDMAIRHLQEGVMLDGIKTAPAQIKVLKRSGMETEIEITIHEGRNRQVKRMFESVGCHVMALKRIAFGSLTLGDLAIGKWRFITKMEQKSIDIQS
jgi:23S rRNA pseudouridine2605 synthase